MIVSADLHRSDQTSASDKRSNASEEGSRTFFFENTSKSINDMMIVSSFMFRKRRIVGHSNQRNLRWTTNQRSYSCRNNSSVLTTKEGK
jgi:hypothetical protein